MKSKNKKKNTEEEIKHIKVSIIKEKETVEEVDIGDFCKEILLFYAACIAVARILPDIRDGLKPGARKIMYAMKELNLEPKGKVFDTKKCARIVGNVLGKYHPHGDQSIYQTLVGLAQYFSVYPLFAYPGGNFGAENGDDAAAMR